MRKQEVIEGVFRYLLWMVSTAAELLTVFLVREFYLVLCEFLGIGPKVIDVIDKLALILVGLAAVAAFVSLFYYYEDRFLKKFLFISCLQIALAAALFFLRSLMITLYIRNFEPASILLLGGLLSVILLSAAGARRVKRVLYPG